MGRKLGKISVATGQKVVRTVRVEGSRNFGKCIMQSDGKTTKTYSGLANSCESEERLKFLSEETCADRALDIFFPRKVFESGRHGMPRALPSRRVASRTVTPEFSTATRSSARTSTDKSKENIIYKNCVKIIKDTYMQYVWNYTLPLLSRAYHLARRSARCFCRASLRRCVVKILDDICK